MKIINCEQGSMEIINCEQGSEEWRTLRLGKITASCFRDAVTSGRGGSESKTRRSYMLKLAAEIVSGQAEHIFISSEMRWGTETEAQARARYEFETGCQVREVGFVKYGDDCIGVSPDGLVGEHGLLEIKCPKTSTQISRFLTKEGLPDQYKAQVQGQLWVCNRLWCDFVSYDPRITGPAEYICTRVERDEEYIQFLSKKIIDFRADLFCMVALLKEKQEVGGW